MKECLLCFTPVYQTKNCIKHYPSKRIRTLERAELELSNGRQQMRRQGIPTTSYRERARDLQELNFG